MHEHGQREIDGWQRTVCACGSSTSLERPHVHHRYVLPSSSLRVTGLGWAMRGFPRSGHSSTLHRARTLSQRSPWSTSEGGDAEADAATGMASLAHRVSPFLLSDVGGDFDEDDDPDILRRKVRRRKEGMIDGLLLISNTKNLHSCSASSFTQCQLRLRETGQATILHHNRTHSEPH